MFKCQDPVIVQLSVNGTTRNVTQSSLYTDVNNNSILAVSIQRDNGSLFFNVSDSFLFNIAVRIYGTTQYAFIHTSKLFFYHVAFLVLV